MKKLKFQKILKDEAREYRGKLLKLLQNLMTILMEKYFEDENSLTEREILNALRQATIGGKVHSNDVWFCF